MTFLYPQFPIYKSSEDLEMLSKKLYRPPPRVFRGLCVVDVRTLIVEERMIGIRIDVHLDRLAQCFQLPFQLTHQFRRDKAVAPGVDAQHWRLQFLEVG